MLLKQSPDLLTLTYYKTRSGSKAIYTGQVKCNTFT